MTMTVVERIRALDAQGMPATQIATRVGVHRDTVAKYTGIDNFSPRPLRKPFNAGTQALAGLTGIIDGWLDDDTHRPRKQRHTAQRIYDRLVDEHGYTGSYKTVQRFVKLRKQAAQGPTDGYSELVWPAGQAQVDFGQATAVIAGVTTLLHLLVVTFPQSNMRYVQSFLGETAECVCQGLRTICEHIGGVPTMMVFDNATGIGRRHRDDITESRLFAAFKAHYRTSARYCNPYAGNEKGNVENAVGFLRRNLMVPEPAAISIDALNTDLLARCDALGARDHWRAKVPIVELFTADQQALIALPGVSFDPVRYETRKADKLGRIQVEGVFYLPGPAYHDRLMTVGIRHDVIEILDETDTPVMTFARIYGEQSTTVFSPGTLLPALKAKPGSWSHSPVRAHVPDPVADWLDTADNRSRSRAFAALEDATTATDYATAMSAAQSLITGGDDPGAGGLGMLARRLGEGGPDPRVVDTLTPAMSRGRKVVFHHAPEDLLGAVQA